MFLACFWKRQYSQGNDVAANHVPPTQHVTVTSCITEALHTAASPASHTVKKVKVNHTRLPSVGFRS